jgi:hypothetical protein
MVNFNMEGPAHPQQGETGPKSDQLSGVIEAEDEGRGPSRQAAPAASLDGDDVEIDDINEQIADANDAIERAGDAVRDANDAIAAANSLIGLWSEQHPGNQIDDIPELDVELYEIDEIEIDED